MAAFSFAIGAVVGSGLGVGQNLLNAYVQPWIEATTYENKLRTWWDNQVIIPDPNQLFAAWQKGFLQPSWVSYWCRQHGIPLRHDWSEPNPADVGNIKAQAWQQIGKSLETPMPLDVALRYRYLGLLDNAQITHQLQLHGFGKQSARDAVGNPRVVPTVTDLMVLRNRERITVDAFNQYLNCNGVTGVPEKELIDNLRYIAPGTSDLITFAVREVFDPAVVARFSYDSEFPQSFQLWMDWQGMGWKPSDLGVVVPAGQDITWPRAYWRAHWQTLSPTQAGYAVHLLRPRVAGSNESRIPGVGAFTTQDMDLLLRVADYPPIIRNWLYGLSFTPLTRIDIRRMRRMGVITSQEVFELYRDLGYTPENAQRLVNFTDEEKFRTESGRDRARMETIIRNAFLTGLTSRNEAARWLYMLRRTSSDAQAAYRALPVTEQEQLAATDPQIVLLLETLSLQKAAKIAGSIIKATAASFKRGEIDATQVRSLLTNVGTEPDDITLYLQLWSAERQIKGKQATISQVATWYKRGAIGTAEAVLRLQRLGVPSRDINILLGLAERDATIAAAREAEKAEKAGRERRRAQEQQMKAMESNRRRIMTDINKSAGRATIVRWLKRLLITPDEAYTALVNRGIYPRDAALYVVDVLKELGEEYAEKIAELLAKAEQEQSAATGTNANGDGMQEPSA